MFEACKLFEGSNMFTKPGTAALIAQKYENKFETFRNIPMISDFYGFKNVFDMIVSAENIDGIYLDNISFAGLRESESYRNYLDKLRLMYTERSKEVIEEDRENYDIQRSNFVENHMNCAHRNLNKLIRNLSLSIVKIVSTRTPYTAYISCIGRTPSILVVKNETFDIYNVESMDYLYGLINYSLFEDPTIPSPGSRIGSFIPMTYYNLTKVMLDISKGINNHGLSDDYIRPFVSKN